MLRNLSLCVLGFAVLAIWSSSLGAQTPLETWEDWESDLRLKEKTLKTAQEDFKRWQKYVQGLPDEARLMEDKKLLEEVKGDFVGQIQSLAEREKQASEMRKMADEQEAELKAWEERLHAGREALEEAQKTWDEKMKKNLLPKDLQEKYRKKFAGTQLGPLRLQKERAIAMFKEQLDALGPNRDEVRKNYQEGLSRLEAELKEVNEVIDSLQETQELNAKKLALQGAEEAIEGLRKVPERLRGAERQASAGIPKHRSRIEEQITALRPKGPPKGGGIVGGLDAALRAMEGSLEEPAGTGQPAGRPKSAQDLEQEVRGLIDPKLAELDKQIREVRIAKEALDESKERLARAEEAWRKAKQDALIGAGSDWETKMHTRLPDAIEKELIQAIEQGSLDEVKVLIEALNRYADISKDKNLLYLRDLGALEGLGKLENFMNELKGKITIPPGQRYTVGGQKLEGMSLTDDEKRDMAAQYRDNGAKALSWVYYNYSNLNWQDRFTFVLKNWDVKVDVEAEDKVWKTVQLVGDIKEGTVSEMFLASPHGNISRKFKDDILAYQKMQAISDGIELMPSPP